MRPLLPKYLFLFSSSSSSSCSSSFSSSPSRALLLLLRLQVCHLSSSSTSYTHHSRRSDEDSRNVRVSVWWDFENCNVPAGVTVSKIAPAITEAVRANGIKGPVQITAFGDVLQLSRPNQEALTYTGIYLSHVPNGGKNSADRSLLVDLMYWVSQNPPPAHLFLISGDRDFAGILHRLRMNNYNILLAIPGKAPDVLCSAATIMWQWPSLLKGEDLTGKHFNHPPDGPFGSWYGHYKVPLENPFLASEQSAPVQNSEICEPNPDSKSGAVPKSVVRKVRQILSSHPKGISIIDLRAELAKYNVRLDKSLYGYKKFRPFLSSMPHIQLKHLGDGNYSVRLAPSESPESFASNDEPSTASAVKNEERGDSTAPNLNGEGKTMARDADRTPSMASLHEKSSEKVGDGADAQSSATQLQPRENEVSKSKTSSKKLPCNEIVTPKDVSPNTSGKYATSDNYSAGNDYTMVENDHIENDDYGKFIAKGKYERPTRKDTYTLPVDDSVVDKRPGRSAETYSKSPTFFGWIRSWWPFGKSSAKSVHLSTPHFEEPMLSQMDMTASRSEEPKLSELDQTIIHAEEPKLSNEEPKLSEHSQTVSHGEDPKSSDEELKLSELDQTVGHSAELNLSAEVNQNQHVGHSKKPELFSMGSFWNDMESFVFTLKGSLLVSLSTSREDLAHKLQKDGPLVLRSLTEKGILQLVDLLTADKKWLEENPSQAYPFRLTQPVQKSSSVGLSYGANGLRSLFLSRTSQSSSQKPFEHDGEKHNQNIPHTSISTPAIETKYAEKSKNDILVDCQKLVNEILREYPEGYNIGCFRKLFVERYGYHLDLQKVGYKNLASLLQTTRGAKLESTYIFPSVPAVCDFDRENSVLKTQVTSASPAVSNSDSELSDSARKDDNIDSPWEELGPVSVRSSNQGDLDSQLSQKAKELDTSRFPDYEPVDADYDSSECEEDSSCLTQPEDQGKLKFNEEDSSFWQALDSWHSNKEGENSVKKSDNVDVLGNSLADILNSSGESTRGTLSKIPSGNYREKQRSQKDYLFVADPHLPEKDKLIDGILDGLKKADESKMQN